MKLAPLSKKGRFVLAALGLAATTLFVGVSPVCSCVSFEYEMALRLGLSDGAEHAAEIVRRELPVGSSVRDVRAFITRGVEPYEREEVARYENGDWSNDVQFDSRRRDARRNFDRFCQETPAQVACRFDTERHLVGQSGFDLVVSLNAERRVDRVSVAVHEWWQGSPRPLGASG